MEAQSPKIDVANLSIGIYIMNVAFYFAGNIIMLPSGGFGNLAVCSVLTEGNDG